MQTTINSVAAQTILPIQWIIVDDGSTDDSPKILAQAARQYPFIKVIQRQDRGKRAVGPGVIEAFYDGFARTNSKDYDYICKLDMDLELPSKYFEYLIEKMEANPRLGTCSGKSYFRNLTGKLISEKTGDEMSVGMIKFYRKECFEEIGGFVHQVMWDGIDCHRCRMMGWISCSWNEPNIRFIHLRPMGSSQKGIFQGRMRHGYGQYFMGTGLLYMTVSALFRMTQHPFLIGGLAMWIGYIQSMLAGDPRYDDPQFRAFLQEYQRNCLIKGKAKATQDLDEFQTNQWNHRRSNFYLS